jgi:hypothetical protein
MRRGFVVGALVAVAVAGVIAVGASGSGDAAKAKPTYRFYTGMMIVFDNGVIRLFVENPTSKSRKVTIRFLGVGGGPTTETLTIGPDDTDSAASGVCGNSAGCNASASVKTKSGAIVPTARYIEASSSAGTGIDNQFSYVRPGDFVVLRDGKRAW